MEKWMKNFLKSFFFLSLLTVGAGLLYAWNDKNKVKKNNRGHYHIHLLPGWVFVNGLNEETVVEAGNREADAYIVAIPYAKSNYENTEKFQQYLLDYIQKLYDDYRLIQSEKLTIDQHEAYLLSGHLKFEEIEYRNFVYGITYEDCYLLIMAWAPENSDDAVLMQMKQIVNTLHQV